MKITADNSDGVRETITSQTAKADRFRTAERIEATATGAGGDSIQISDLSAKLLETPVAEDAARAGRVAELAAAYARGECEVDSTALSQAIVSQSLRGRAEGEK
jgi:anti-sigma28 factor (negative regulator of flagellin synthesis)